MTVILLLAGPSLHGETPAQAVDRIWNATMSREPGLSDDAFAQAQMRLVQQIAREQGVAVIPPIMARAKTWKGDEILVFVGLVSSLPPAQTTPILQRFKKSGKPWERQCATDFLIEINELRPIGKNDAWHETGTLPQ